MNGLTYIGKGSFVVGIPARNLTAEEVKKFGGEDFVLTEYPSLYKRTDAVREDRAVTDEAAPAVGKKQSNKKEGE